MKTLTNPYLATLLLSSLAAQAAAADRLVDPTRPANAKAVASNEQVERVRLEAIMRSDGAHIAIVNGKVVRAGDRVGSARIDEVSSSGIRYTRDGRSYAARLDNKVLQVRRNVVRNEDET
jgi:MSHA biogenesis protein MshK